MEGLFGLSINKRTYRDDFRQDLLFGTFYQQHFKEDVGGLAVFNGKRIRHERHPGLFLSSFTTKRMKNFNGTEGIGYCGSAREPFSLSSGLRKFSLCFSGKIINCSDLIQQFKDKGYHFGKEDEAELVAKLISRGRDMVDGIREVIDQIMGSIVLLILTPEGIYAFRSSLGHWPLIIGRKKGAIAIATSSAGFENLGFGIWRELEPGDVVLIKNGGVETKYRFPGVVVQICSFLWVYRDFPCGKIKGTPSSLVRKRLGAMAARRDIKKGFIPDIVSAVQDSGRFHAIGYHQEFCRQINTGDIKKVPLLDEALLKYTYAGKSFTRQTQRESSLVARIKQLGSAERYDDMILVECEDSIVSGTQTQEDLGPKLRKRGFREIHFRVSFPAIYSNCPWDRTGKKGEPLASRIPSKQERIKFLGIDGLEHNTAEDLVRAIGLPAEQLCMDCILKRPPR